MHSISECPLPTALARPVISPSELNRHLRTVNVASMTTGNKPAPFRVAVTFEGKRGLILLDQIRTLDKLRLMKRLGPAELQRADPTAFCFSPSSAIGGGVVIAESRRPSGLTVLSADPCGLPVTPSAPFDAASAQHAIGGVDRDGGKERRSQRLVEG